MAIFRKIKLWVKDLLLISNLDRRAEREVRKMRRLYEKGGFINKYRSRRIENKLRIKYGLILPCSAKIGKNFQIRHPQGVGIGPTAEIGDNCKVYPYFEVMAALKGDHERNINHIPRHAKIGNDCILGSHACVIGHITIGDDVTIAACAIVTKDVPSHSVVKGLNQIRPKRLEEIPEKYRKEMEK
jgi:serine acetyltransferase